MQPYLKFRHTLFSDKKKNCVFTACQLLSSSCPIGIVCVNGLAFVLVEVIYSRPLGRQENINPASVTSEHAILLLIRKQSMSKPQVWLHSTRETQKKLCAVYAAFLSKSKVVSVPLDSRSKPLPWLSSSIF